ncbi:Coiled-coil domain-containing protein 77 [Borealophlyctis nickersoniae]|nr:Coiled-coil domain-containing protein 77 [Borealophlyctis nickersoniae]
MDHDLRKLPLSPELLIYYRKRLEQCEQDYQDAIDRMTGLGIPHDETHKVAWEAHKRAGEVAELQQALSDAQAALFEERRAMLRVMAENDQLKGKRLKDNMHYFPFTAKLLWVLTLDKRTRPVQELKDRKKIRYLLSITGAPEEETTYFRDKLDKRLVKVARGSSRGERAGKQTSDQKSEERDIIVLEDEVVALKLKLASLQTQLDEQKEHYEATIADLMRDRKTRMEEEKVRREHEAQKIGELTDKVHRLRALCRENTRGLKTESLELLHTKKTSLAHERRLIEEKTAMTDELNSLKNQLLDEKDRQENAERNIESRVTKKQESLVSELRGLLGKYEEEIRVVTANAANAEAACKRKIEHLQNRLSAINSSYASLKRRRDYEIEGFTNDILMLRKQLKSLEKSILRYAPLEDKELVLLNLARETGERVSKISSDLHGLKAKLYSTEEEVRSLAF